MRGNVLKTKTVARCMFTFPTKKQRENPTRTTLIPTVAAHLYQAAFNPPELKDCDAPIPAC